MLVKTSASTVLTKADKKPLWLGKVFKLQVCPVCACSEKFGNRSPRLPKNVPYPFHWKDLSLEISFPFSFIKFQIIWNLVLDPIPSGAAHWLS